MFTLGILDVILRDSELHGLRAPFAASVRGQGCDSMRGGVRWDLPLLRA